MSQEPVTKWSDLANLAFNPSPFVPNAELWGQFQEREPDQADYSLAYAHARQRMGLSPESARAFAQVEADGRVHNDPTVDPGWDRQWSNAWLQSPLPSTPPVQAPPIPTAETAEAYNQLRLPLESRLANGQIASITRVSNPEVVAASLLDRALDLSAPVPLDSADQLELARLLELAETNKNPAAAPTTGEPPPERRVTEALPQRTPNGRRLAGGYAVTGGLGLLGLLGLAALTDPYEA